MLVPFLDEALLIFSSLSHYALCLCLLLLPTKEIIPALSLLSQLE